MAAPAVLLGRPQPRLYTPPLRPLNRHTSLGYEVCAFADEIGEPFLPWQRWTAIHALETLPGGLPRFRTVLILVARQNGKSALKRTISLWRLYRRGARLVIGIAQDVDQALEQMNLAIETIEDVPALDPDQVTVCRVNGREHFKLPGGGRYKVKAANRKAGRGLAGVDEVNIDELRTQTDWLAWGSVSKTTMASASAQLWAMSNAGDDDSIVLNALRETALSGRDPSLGIFEYSGPDGCELDDISAIRQANPGLGHIIGQPAIFSALGTDPPEVYRTEVLCQRVERLDGAIDLAAWKECADTGTALPPDRKRIAACFDISPDGRHATLAAAAKLPDGRVRVQVIAAWKTAAEVHAGLPGLLDQLRPAHIAWYPSGPGGAFVPMLRGRPGSEELTGMRAAEACMGLAALVKARGIVHAGEPLLDSHISAAQKLPASDGWRFTRRGNNREGHVDAAYAAAGAVHVALTMVVAGRPRIRIVG